MQEVLARIAIDPVPPVTSARATVPPAIARAITRALAKAPADRFSTAAEFAAALERGAHSGEQTPAIRRRWLVWSAAPLVIAAAALIALRGPFGAHETASAKTRLAVMYFDNQSPDTADRYLADGLTEEIIQRLGEVSRFDVKSRYAVRRFRGASQPDPAAVGRALDVSMLVSGSVRHSQQRTRIAVELVRATNGDHVWGKEFDRTDVDLLTLESEVAQAVASAVAGRLAPQERARLGASPTSNGAAYDHFLRGDFLLAQRNAVATATAITEYETAMRLDSSFTRPLARMAFAYALFVAWEWPHPRLSWDSLFARGSRDARAALARDSALSDAWMANGMFEWYRSPTSFDRSLASFDRAIALDSSSAEAFNVRGVTLLNMGKDSLAESSFRAALALDPARPISLTWLGQIEFVDGRRAEGRRLLDSTLAISPAFVPGVLNRMKARLVDNDLAGALADAETAVRLTTTQASIDPGALAGLAQVLALRGELSSARERLAAARAQLQSLDGLHPNTASALAPAMLAVGDREGALRVLERAVPRGLMLRWYLRWPDFDPLRSDPRFEKIVAGSPVR
jgi:TolB-like protein/Flp pilus assembly protein TadD